MQVRLTEDGQKALGFLPDRKIVVVSDERAFALMSGGYAIKDKGFMALFDGPLPEKPEPEVIPESKPEKKKEPEMKKDQEPKKEQPKKETATSKKAENRKKAVKK